MKIVIPWNELEFTATRSSGAGGQHVNKTNSAVQLRFSVMRSLVLTDYQKHRIIKKLAHRIVGDNEILIRSEEERDQKRNKDKAYEDLNKMINVALIEPKKRVATKPKKSSIQKRLNTKKHNSEIKKGRSGKWD
ncbi:aminoacyl-tRNA hydrolase [bacterium]|nr:aminoacyl-tRNA hydrolase [bacterium]